MLYLILFVLAQLLHVLADAFMKSQNVNTKWQSITQYVSTNLSKLIAQFVLGVALFLIVIGNTSAINGMGLGNAEALLSLKGKAGVVLILGWFVDSFLDKLLGFWGLKREV